ncbi:MAG: PQQ-like beta-propeller repeat protein [Pirellulales bacterium]
MSGHENRLYRLSHFGDAACKLRVAAWLAVVLAAAAIERTQAEDWPSWRGPRHDGRAVAAKLPNPWPTEAPQPLWTQALGEGWASPIVVDGRVFVVDRRDAVERAAAYDAATGSLLWERTNPVDFDPHPVGRRHGNGPKATPVYSDGKVYTLGIAGWLQCLDTRSGAVVWTKNLPAEFGAVQPLPDNRAFVQQEDYVVVPIGEGRGAPVPLFGYTGSPLVVDDLLVTSVGGARGGTIMAFDKRTGAVAWKAFEENTSYSSPILAAPAGRRQIVVATGPQLVGLNIADGKKLWDVPYQNQYDETISTPVVIGDHVLLTAVGRPLSAWRLVPEGDGFRAAEAWENHDMSSYLSSVVADDRHVFGMNDGGEWNCADLRDGKLLWRGGNHGYYCTPIWADDRLLALNEQGELAVIAADPQGFRQLAMNKLTDEATWTSPAVVGNRLFIRSQSKLLCFEYK